MRDELKKLKVSRNECMVINIADSFSDETHWVCLFINNGCSYYFDSYRITFIKNYKILH